MTQKEKRLERLNKALTDVVAINGSPDIISSIIKAIEYEHSRDDNSEE